MIIQKHKKAQFSTATFLIAGLLFSIIIALFVLQVAEIENNYPGSDMTNEDFAENYDQLSEISENVETMRETASSSEGLEFRGLFDVTFGSFFTVIQLLLSTLTLFVSMGTNFVTDFPFLDSKIINLFFIFIGAVLTSVIVLKIVNAVGRNKV